MAKHSTLSEEEFFDTVECFDFDDLVDYLLDELHPKRVCHIYGINVSDFTPVKPNFELLRPIFGWALVRIVK
jgi:hypothetical protein